MRGDFTLDGVPETFNTSTLVDHIATSSPLVGNAFIRFLEVTKRVIKIVLSEPRKAIGLP